VSRRRGHTGLPQAGYLAAGPGLLGAGEKLVSAGGPLLLAGAAGIGLAAGQAASGRLALLAGLAVAMAAANGYAKAYSP
jgi:hypothetical protein